MVSDHSVNRTSYRGRRIDVQSLHPKSGSCSKGEDQVMQKVFAEHGTKLKMSGTLPGLGS